MRKKIKYYILICFIFLSHTAIANKSNEEKEERKLKNIQNQMKNVASRIDNAKNKNRKLEEELRKSELTAFKLAEQLENTRFEILKKNDAISNLEIEKKKYKKIIKKEKEKLGNQIRNTYQVGKYNYIKLLLNQDNMSQINRIVAYYDYDNYARSNRIKNLSSILNGLNNVKKEIQKENDNLKLLDVTYRTKLNDYDQIRKKRLDSIVEIKNYIEKQDIELILLKENERDLGKLLKKLKQNTYDENSHKENSIAFSAKKGKLKWPVKGKLLKKYGVLKKAAGLKWQGVLIKANSGSEVRAISDGKIVFADWFRNYGLLIIIEHDNGYLSLYGHNQKILKSTGELVKTREIIAAVGDSGGQNNPALYFEIRKGKKTLNPSRWCKN